MSDPKRPALKLPKPVTVETAAGVMTVHPLSATAIEECMGAVAEGETDEQIGRRVLRLIVTDDSGAALEQARFDLITTKDLKALAVAGLRNGSVLADEGPDVPLARLGVAVRRGHELSLSTVRRLAEAADAFQGLKLGEQLAKAAEEHGQLPKNFGHLLNDKIAQLPPSISAQMAQHGAALEAATNALRTSAASFFTDENQRAAGIFKAALEAQKDPFKTHNRRFDLVPDARLTESVSSPILDNLREQTALIKQEHAAVLETARRTAELSAHMGTVAAEISTISNTLITKVLPAWHHSDVESRNAAQRNMRIAVGALVATVIIGAAQIVYNRLDRSEDLERIAKEAEQNEQRERAANARLEEAERDAAATREVLKGLKSVLDATAEAAASAATSTTAPPVRSTPGRAVASKR